LKLVDVTNSYGTLVAKQLANTDSYLVRVYSLGKTMIVFSEAPSHVEIVIVNKMRDIKRFEIEQVVEELLGTTMDNGRLKFIHTKGIVEISAPSDIKESI